MKRGLLANLAEMWDYRDLLVELVGREMRLRYRRSTLGILWSLITPLYQIVIYTFVFKYIMHVEGKNLSVNILVGLIPWAFFSTGVLNSCAAIDRGLAEEEDRRSLAALRAPRVSGRRENGRSRVATSTNAIAGVS